VKEIRKTEIKKSISSMEEKYKGKGQKAKQLIIDNDPKT